MSGCCDASKETGTMATSGRRLAAADATCPVCDGGGHPVAHQTVLHHVRPDRLGQVGDGEAYYFCSSPACAVVYYGEDGTSFTVEDVRERITAKACGDARPICYCFGFTEGDARQEIERTGASTIPARISRLIKAGMCACEVRNPSGACCLGQVNQTVKRLSAEHRLQPNSGAHPPAIAARDDFFCAADPHGDARVDHGPEGYHCEL